MWAVSWIASPTVALVAVVVIAGVAGLTTRCSLAHTLVALLLLGSPE